MEHAGQHVRRVVLALAALATACADAPELALAPPRDVQANVGGGLPLTLINKASGVATGITLFKPDPMTEAAIFYRQLRIEDLARLLNSSNPGTMGMAQLQQQKDQLELEVQNLIANDYRYKIIGPNSGVGTVSGVLSTFAASGGLLGQYNLPLVPNGMGSLLRTNYFTLVEKGRTLIHEGFLGGTHIIHAEKGGHIEYVAATFAFLNIPTD